jgi:hypothetical protein
VTDEDGPVPEDGTTLAVEPEAGTRSPGIRFTARIEGGEVVADDVGSVFVQALAHTPDGRVAPLVAGNGGELGRPTSFRVARKIEVVATWPDGSPASGLFVVARNLGNNPLREPVPLDGEGRATIAGLHGGLATVFLVVPGEAASGRGIGSVDLDAGDARLEVVVPRPRRVLLRLSVDGEKRLPAKWSASVGRMPLIDVEEDPEAGEISFSWLPGSEGAQGWLSFTAPGLLPGASFEGPGGLLALAGAGEEPEVLDVDLRSGGALAAKALLPADKSASLVLQRFHGPDGAWTQVGAPRSELVAVGSVGVQRFAPLAPGRYRVVETSTGIESAEAEVIARGAETSVTIDLRSVGSAQGRVVLPEGHGFAGARVHGEGLPESLAPTAALRRGVGVLPPDGSFVFRVPGDRPITLVAVHPTLVPDPEAGRVVVIEPRDGIVLRLVEGAVANLGLEPPPPPATDAGGEIAVLLFRGEVGADPAFTLMGQADGKGIRFGGYEPGTYTIWVRVPGYAPLILAHRVLGGGATDLGAARLSRGATVRVRILVADGQTAPPLVLNAWREESPAYGSVANSRGEDVVLLQGLGPGRYELFAGSMHTALKQVIRETLVVEGDETHERTLDLR